MGTALKAYTEHYEGKDQVLFQAVVDLKRGNKRAFEQVYKYSERYIYAIIHRIIQDNEKTVDLMQDTYIQIYKKIHTLKNVEAFFTWAGRIATHNTLRFIQKNKREILLDEEANEYMFDNEVDDDEEFIPEDVLINKEKKNKIRKILNSLSQVQKLTVHYYYFSGMSVNEIAEAMQCSVGTVKSRLNYARKQIKQAVLDTEKKEGIRLYSLSALPLFTLLLREEAASIAVPEIVSSSVIKGLTDALGIKLVETAGAEAAGLGKAGIRETIKRFFQTTGGKVTSGVAAVAVAGTVAVTQIPKDVSVMPGSIESHMNPYYSYHAEIQLYPEDVENPYLIDGKYLIVENADGQKGLYTIDGKEIMSCEFEHIFYDDNTGGLFLAEKDDKWAYYDKSGKMVCDRMHDEVSNIHDGLFWGYDWDSDKYVVYTTEGRRVSDDAYDFVDEMANGLFTAKKGYEWGVVDKNGQIIADFVYFTAHLGDGEYIALTKEIDSTTRELIVLDSSGKLVNREVYEGGLRFFGSGFYNGVAQLLGWYELPMKPDGSILFNTVGTDYASESLGYHLEVFPNGYFSYYNYRKDNGEISLFNQDAREIAVAAYGSIKLINNHFLIKDNDSGKYSLIDLEGNTLISQYDYIEPRYKGEYFICSDENGYDLYRQDGTLLFDDAEYIDSLGCEMFECRHGDLRIILNAQDGTSFQLSPDEFIESGYADGYAIKLTEIWGEEDTIKYEIIDKKGKVEHRIKFPADDIYYYQSVLVLGQGLYSYEYEGKTYIKSW